MLPQIREALKPVPASIRRFAVARRGSLWRGAVRRGAVCGAWRGSLWRGAVRFAEAGSGQLRRRMRCGASPAGAPLADSQCNATSACGTAARCDESTAHSMAGGTGKANGDCSVSLDNCGMPLPSTDSFSERHLQAHYGRDR
jgi:hypothetical protein